MTDKVLARQGLNNVNDPRRPERIVRYVAPSAVVTASGERKDVPGEVDNFYILTTDSNQIFRVVTFCNFYSAFVKYLRVTH